MNKTQHHIGGNEVLSKPAHYKSLLEHREHDYLSLSIFFYHNLAENVFKKWHL